MCERIKGHNGRGGLVKISCSVNGLTQFDSQPSKDKHHSQCVFAYSQVSQYSASKSVRVSQSVSEWSTDITTCPSARDSSVYLSDRPREGPVFSSHLHPVDLFKLAATTVLNMSDSRSDFDRSPSPIDPRYGHLRIPTNNSSEYCKRFIQKPQFPIPIDSIEQIY